MKIGKHDQVGGNTIFRPSVHQPEKGHRIRGGHRARDAVRREEDACERTREAIVTAVRRLCDKREWGAGTGGKDKDSGNALSCVAY